MTNIYWLAFFFIVIWFIGTCIDNARITSLEQRVDILSRRIDLRKIK